VSDAKGQRLSGAVDHFERHARAFEAHAEGRPEFEERFRLWASTIDRLWPAGGAGATAIDLGCGPGHLTQQLAARGFRTIAIDGSEAMLSRTRDRIDQHGLGHADLRRHDLPLPTHVEEELAGQAQLIVMSSVIEYIEDDEEMLRQLGRLLAPGGHLLASFPNRRSVYWRLQRVLKRTPLFARSASRHQRHQYDSAMVSELSRLAGLELQRMILFSLPLHRYAHRVVVKRRPRVATLFLADLERPRTWMGNLTEPQF
jgi:2-polyprenyl-3-methyl-5-hydroxy-6-metoxy-1,4-benzoquinol methylase